MATVRKRGLPDLRPRVLPAAELNPDGSEAEFPPPNVVESLRVRHSLRADFDLGEALEGAWFWWRTAIQSGRDPPPSVHVKFLRQMERRAAALEEALERAGIWERRVILNVLGDRRIDLNDLKRTVARLRVGAHLGAREIPLGRPGRKGERELIELICKLYRIYKTSCMKKPSRITKADRYGGRHFEFVEDVLKTFGVRRSNQSLGKLIEKATAAVDRSEARRAQSPKSVAD